MTALRSPSHIFRVQCALFDERANFGCGNVGERATLRADGRCVGANVADDALSAPPNAEWVFVSRAFPPHFEQHTDYSATASSERKINWLCSKMPHALAKIITHTDVQRKRSNGSGEGMHDAHLAISMRIGHARRLAAITNLQSDGQVSRSWLMAATAASSGLYRQNAVRLQTSVCA